MVLQDPVKNLDSTPYGIRDLIDDLSESLALRGFQLQGYTTVSLGIYEDLPETVRQQVFAGLRAALDLVNAAPEKAQGLELDRFMLGSACRALDLKPTDDFIATLKEGDIIEIYELETQTQVYRNLEFLRHCSYDLLTVCIVPYPELFERESGYNEKIIERTSHITNMADRMEPWGVANHELVERLHPNRRRFKLNLGHIAPVVNAKTGKRVAWASRIRVECVGSIFQNLPNVVPF